MKKKMPVHPFGEETDDFWHGPDFVHEIYDSELKARLSHKYWSGVLLGTMLAFLSCLAWLIILN